MSDPKSTSDAPRFEVNTGGDESASATFLPDGSVQHSDGSGGASIEMNPDGTAKRQINYGDENAVEDLEAEEGAEEEAAAKEGSEEETTKQDEEVSDLPAFDADNEEVLKQYEAKYVSESGELKFEAFNGSFYKSYAADPDKADISADERAFVKKRTGISDAGIDTYLKGVKADLKASDEALHSSFGGKENYDAAFGWAVGEGGYTAAQKARFNAAFESGDAAAIEEQVDLLKARHAKANPTASTTAAPEVKQRRSASPGSSATNAASSSSTPAVEPFASLDAYQKAAAAAHASEDVQQMRDVEKRLKASPKLWKRS